MGPCAADYAWQHPNPQAIKDAGYVGVLRYLSADPSKNLTPAERDALHAAGLGILLAWETTTTRATQGSQAGVADATAANNQADELGYPPDLPIYYAVDEQAAWAQVAGYFAGAMMVHRRPVKPYGDAAVIDGFFAAYGSGGWQTEAWSGGTVSPHAELYQRVAPTRPPIAGAQGGYDEDAVLLPVAWWGLEVPPATPAPTYSDGGDPVNDTFANATITTGDKGEGYADVSGDPGKLKSIIVEGFDPENPPEGAGEYFECGEPTYTGPRDKPGVTRVSIPHSNVARGQVALRLTFRG